MCGIVVFVPPLRPPHYSRTSIIRTSIIWTFICFPGPVFSSWILITCDLVIISYCIIYLFIHLLSSCSYTWSYENRVSKHFVFFLNFPCLIACLLCCLLISLFLLVLWLGICVEVDVNRITILPPPPTFPIFFSLPTILCLTQVTVIWSQCAPKAGFGAV